MNFLPGWFPGGAVVGGDILLTQVLSAAADQTVAVPSGVIAGDIIILASVAQAGDADAPDFSNPAGFTLLFNQDANPGGSRAVKTRIYGKIASGSEDGTNITVFTDSDDARNSFIVVFRPNVFPQSMTAIDTAGDATAGNPSAATVGTGMKYQLAVGLFSGTAGVDTRSTTPTQDGELLEDQVVGGPSPSTLFSAFRWNVFAPSIAQAVTSDMDDEGGSNTVTAVAILVT